VRAVAFDEEGRRGLGPQHRRERMLGGTAAQLNEAMKIRLGRRRVHFIVSGIEGWTRRSQCRSRRTAQLEAQRAQSCRDEDQKRDAERRRDPPALRHRRERGDSHQHRQRGGQHRDKAQPVNADQATLLQHRERKWRKETADQT